jgi:diguanylate cyclase
VESASLSSHEVLPLAGRSADRASLRDSALDAIVSVDEADRIVEFNPSAEAMFGIAHADAIGRSLGELIVPPEAREAHRSGVAGIAAGAPLRFLGQRHVRCALRADGTRFPIELSVTRTSHEPLLLTAFMRDLTEQHVAQEALRRSEELFSRAFEQAPVGVALVSIDPADPGRLVQVNDAICRMVRMDEDELLSHTFRELTHPDDRATNDALFADVLSGRRSSYEIEKRFIRSDGAIMWALVHGTVLRDADGKPYMGLGQVVDITERRDTEDALLRTQLLAHIGSWEWDIAADRFTWSQGLESIFGPPPPPEVRIGHEAFLSIVHPEDRARVQQVVDSAIGGQMDHTWEYRAVNGDHIADMYAWGEVVLEGGAPVRLRGYAQDVTGRREAERRVAGLMRENELILESAADGILRVDSGGVVRYANPAAERLLGFGPGDLAGLPVSDVALTDHPGAFRRSDGSTILVDENTAPLRGDDGKVGSVVVFSDVTERREMEAQLRRFAEEDGLTGLPNRRSLEHAVAARLDAGLGGALLLLDLDHFKFVNDSFGHAAGDELIRVVADVLRDQTRGDDIIGRLGGDEFAILLPGGQPEEASAVAQRLIAGIEAARPSGLTIGASIGAACFAPGDNGTPGDLLVAADIALYEAKNAGRGRVAFFSGRPGSSLTWVQRIRAALDEGRMVLHAQPIVDLATGAHVHDELLVRMLDEQGTLIPPSSFLPTAESFGLIGDIDRWVLARGVEAAAAGRCVHLNLSGSSLGSAEVLETLESSLRDTGAHPGNVVIEVTETLAVANMAQARAFAHRVRALGCSLALDDFGTGFGSFTYLKNIPADYLKIDMSFVRELARSEVDQGVVDAIVGIAGRFGLRTIAEGVEDEETLLLLTQAGVDLAQGYHLGRPAAF